MSNFEAMVYEVLFDGEHFTLNREALHCAMQRDQREILAWVAVDPLEVFRDQEWTLIKVDHETKWFQIPCNAMWHLWDQMRCKYPEIRFCSVGGSDAEYKEGRKEAKEKGTLKEFNAKWHW